MSEMAAKGLDAWITDDYGQGPERRRLAARSESLVYDMSTVMDEIEDHPPFPCKACGGTVVWFADEYRCRECDMPHNEDGTVWRG